MSKVNGVTQLRPSRVKLQGYAVFMRLFAAIRPPQEVIEHLVTALRPIRSEQGRAIRWTDPDQWHITCAFYGECPGGAEEDLAEDLRELAAATPPMDLRLRGAGSFSGRTLWMGVGGDVGKLRLLLEDRQRPHLTVARAHGVTPMNGLVHALSVYEGPEWRTTRLGLYSSELGAGRSGGPRHELIDEFVLAGL